MAGAMKKQIERRGWIKTHPEIYDRDARLKKLDEFGSKAPSSTG